jgi:hypothetical protein
MLYHGYCTLLSYFRAPTIALFFQTLALTRVLSLFILSSLTHLRTNLIIGDSHARQFYYGGKKTSSSGLIFGLDASLVNKSFLIWLGPRTAYGFAKYGFKSPTHLFVFRQLLRYSKLVIYSFGEIDLRVHSAKPWGSPEAVYTSLDCIGTYLCSLRPDHNLDLSFIPLLPPPPHTESDNLCGLFKPSSPYSQRRLNWLRFASICSSSPEFYYVDLSPRSLHFLLNYPFDYFVDFIHLNANGLQQLYPHLLTAFKS